MAWSVPRTWVATELVTAGIMNTHIRDQYRQLWHEIHYEEFTSNIATGAEWTSASVTFAGNPIRLEWYIPFWQGPTATNDQVATKWRKDGADFADAVTAFNNPSGDSHAVGITLMERVAAPSSGAHTYGLKNNGGTPMTFFASAGSPSHLTIWERGG